MCGIVALLAAYNNGFTKNEVDTFTDMLLMDTMRGKDSTGVFSVDHNTNVDIAKAALNGAAFIEHPSYKKMAQSLYYNGLFMVGHNRAATRGEINDKNAHPFWINDEIVLVQNGTWYGSHKHVKDTEVDTETVAHIIQEHPDNVQAALKKINAAYTLIWYNVKNTTLYAVRNDQRPLYIARTKAGGTLLASEYGTIWYAAFRNNLDLANDDAIVEVPEDTLFSWKITDNGKKYESDSIKVDTKYEHAGGRAVVTYFPGYESMFGFDYDTQAQRHSRRYSGKQSQRQRNSSSHTATVALTTVNDPITHAGITKTILEYASEGRFPDSEQIYHEAYSSKTHLESLLSRNNKVFVELSEYLPASTNEKDCRSWYVFGGIMAIETDPKILVYGLVVNKSEEEVMNMCTKNVFWRGTAHDPAMIVNRRNRAEANYIVRCYISELEESVIEANA